MTDLLAEAQSKRAHRRLTPGGVLTFFAYLGAAALLAISGLIFSGQVGARVVLTNSMAPTINPGDLVVTANWQKPRVGQIAIYQAKDFHGKVRAEYVHRVVAGSADTEYTFRGDNNASNDVLPVKASAVIGVVAATIPNANIFLHPLVLGSIFVGFVLIYFLAAFIRHRRNQTADDPLSFTNNLSIQNERKHQVTLYSKLSSRVKGLVFSAVFLVVIYFLLSGLGAAKVLGFEHPQVGPNLAVGNATSTIAVVAPGGQAKAGQYAMANLNGVRNFVRVDAITSDGYQISAMSGTGKIPADKLDGPLLFFIPFLGYLWLPFGA